MKSIIYLGRTLGAVFSRAIIKPLRIIAIFIFRYFLVPMYQVYFVIKKWALKIFAPAKNKIIFPLLNKSTIHFVIIVIALATIVNNFVIKETKAEEFGSKTILGSMVTDIEDIEIVETALTENGKTTDYYQRLGLLSSSEAGVNPQAAQVGKDDIVTTESSAALVKPALASTTIGDRPRDQVIYYAVEGGDTVSTIAEKFKVTTNTILWENKLGPRDYIKPGDKLTILPQSGVSHQVKTGDTIDKIAKKYSVENNDILEYNQLVDASAIEKDQVLIIPEGVMPEAPKPRTTSTGSGLGYIPPSSSAYSGAKLLWPTTSRKINQYYKWRHLAIDIEGNYNSPVYAADNGRVEAVGWGRGYGNRIIVNHGNGLKTLYAHESKMFVRVGDSVSRGQTIGMVGCTGWCTGAHVHFEVFVNGSKVNPLTYL